ncbi:MAG: hypothetical protein GW867_22905 [Armatimonadetes bacterium]|nr:hypothetical protein [Armatimonadota bacterium]
MTRSRRAFWILLPVALGSAYAFWGTGFAQTTGYRLVSSILDSGGGRHVSGSYVLTDSVGQLATGRKVSGSHVLTQGFLSAGGTSLLVTAANKAPQSAPVGQSNLAMLRLDLKAVGEANVTLSSLQVSRLGSAGDSDLTNVKLYTDTNASGEFEAAQDTRVGTTRSFSGGVATFTQLSFPLPSGEGKALFVVCDVASNAVAGRTFGISLESAASLTATNADHVSPTTPFPLSSNETAIENTLQEFTLEVTPASQAVLMGDRVEYQVKVVSIGGYSSAVTLSTPGLDAALTTSFGNTVLTPTPEGAVTSLSATAKDSAEARDYGITIQGVGADPESKTRSTTATLRVQDFTVTASPQTQQVLLGKRATFDLEVRCLNSFSNTVALTWAGDKADVTLSSAPADPVACGWKGTLEADATAAAQGRCTITVTGQSGARTKATQAILDVVPPTPSEIVLDNVPTGVEVGTKYRFKGHISPSPGSDQFEVTVLAKEPGSPGAQRDGQVGTVFNKADGTFEFDVTFDKAGGWSLVVSWGGVEGIAPDTSPDYQIPVMRDAGYAIIVAGRDWKGTVRPTNDPTNNKIISQCDRVYETLHQLGFQEDRLVYLSRHTPAPQQPRVSDDANLNNISGEIARLRGRANSSVPVLLYLADHGWRSQAGYELGAMRLGDENLRGTDLASWLAVSDLAAVPITIVYDACYAGSFLNPAATPPLTGPNRCLVAASAADKVSFTHPDQVGLMFSTEFFRYLGQGHTLCSAFQEARDAMLYLQPWKHLDYPTKLVFPDPQINYPSGSDLCERTLGVGTLGDAPVITAVEVTFPSKSRQPGPAVQGTVGERGTIAVRADAGLGFVRAVIVPPAPEVGDSTTGLVDLVYPTPRLDEMTPGVYEGFYEGFGETGTYLVYAFAARAAEGPDALLRATAPNPVQVRITKKATRSVGGGWHLLSCPLLPLDPAPAAAFGQPYQLKEWSSDPQQSGYRDPSRVDPGKGYWLFTGTAASPQVEGDFVSRLAPFAISLKRGWNLIGHPFDDWETLWSDCTVNGPSTPVGAANDTLAPVLYSHDPGTGYAVHLAGENSARLCPFDGYWTLALQDCTLHVPHKAAPSRSRRRSRSAETGDGVRWDVGLLATSSVGSAQVRLRVAPGATEGFDGLSQDVPSPPAGASALRAYFDRPQWRQPALAVGGEFMVDTRSASAPQWAWDFVVRLPGEAGNRGGIDTRSPAAPLPVTLSWADLAQVPRNVSLTIHDLSANMSRYLRTCTGYSFTLAPGEVRQFRVLALAHGAAPLRISNVAVAPTRGGGFTVQYSLSKPAQVQATIRSATGRVVGSMSSGRAAGAGINTLAFSGRAEGKTLGRGVYLVELTARTEEGQAARAIQTVTVR